MIKAIDFSKWNGLPRKKEFLSRKTWLSAGNVIFLKGKFNVGKSLFVQQLMTAVATGYTWFDESVGKIKTYGIFCEDDETKLWHRQCGINELYRLNMRSPDLINNVHLMPRKGEYNILIAFDDYGVGHVTSYFDDLLKDIQLFQPKLVVLDEVLNLLWREEHSEHYLCQFIRSCCTRIAKIANCTVLLCQHDNSEKVGKWDNKTWYLVRKEEASDKRVLYGYGIHHMECYQDKVFHNVGDSSTHLANVFSMCRAFESS